MAAIPTYNLSDPVFRRALSIQQHANSGVVLFANPIIADLESGQADVDLIRNAINETLPCVTVDTATAELDSLLVDLTAAEDAMTALRTHTDSLLFGDENDTLISGGFVSNAAQAQAANTLFNTVNCLGGGINLDGIDLDGIETGCALIDEFFGSLLGQAQIIINLIKDAILAALGPVYQLMSAIGSLVTDMTTAIAAAAQLLQAATAQALDLIAREIQAFTDWAQRAIDLALGNFLSALQEVPCIGDLIAGVQTPELGALLETPNPEIPDFPGIPIGDLPGFGDC